jgi:hypothetical protein
VTGKHIPLYPGAETQIQLLVLSGLDTPHPSHILGTLRQFLIDEVGKRDDGREGMNERRKVGKAFVEVKVADPAFSLVNPQVPVIAQETDLIDELGEIKRLGQSDEAAAKSVTTKMIYLVLQREIG